MMLFAEKIRTAMRESTDRKRIFKHQIARLFLSDSVPSYWPGVNKNEQTNEKTKPGMETETQISPEPGGLGIFKPHPGHLPINFTKFD